MSIEQINKVDLLGLNKGTGKIELGIIDDLDWDEPKVHLQLLQDKINAYLSFIESGEIYESYPEAKNRSFKILIATKYQPDKIGKDFINSLRKILSSAGYELQLKEQLEATSQ